MSDMQLYNSAMSPLLLLDALSWDSWNLEHIAKHDVTVAEILEALDHIVEGKATYKSRFLVVGTTEQGRVLSIVIGRDPQSPTIWYVFSARDASRKERANFRTSSGNANL